MSRMTKLMNFKHTTKRPYGMSFLPYATNSCNIPSLSIYSRQSPMVLVSLFCKSSFNITSRTFYSLGLSLSSMHFFGLCSYLVGSISNLSNSDLNFFQFSFNLSRSFKGCLGCLEENRFARACDVFDY